MKGANMKVKLSPQINPNNPSYNRKEIKLNSKNIFHLKRSKFWIVKDTLKEIII